MADAWRAAFVRRRVTLVVRGARAALLGRRHEEEDESAHSTRKKDAPDHRGPKRGGSDSWRHKRSRLQWRSAAARMGKPRVAAR